MSCYPSMKQLERLWWSFTKCYATWKTLEQRGLQGSMSRKSSTMATTLEKKSAMILQAISGEHHDDER